jgi:ParB-like chromosome segregation protein Spo0J
MAQGVKVDEVVFQNIARLAQEGKTGNQIAKALGIARSTVQQCLKRLGEDAGANHGQGRAIPAHAEPMPAPAGSESLPVALVIDPEFRSVIPTLTGEERAQLARSLREEGCRDPLVVWPQPVGAPILVDGHNGNPAPGEA